MISRKLSHYQILEKLGAGGMGEVYLAQDLNLERKVAIKFLPQNLTSDAENVERFRREAKAAAALNHPNIITIYEISEEKDQLFIVMEYVDGTTLRELISTSSQFPVPNYLSIMTQICEGLSKAHQAGIIHRDIKPANIMITGDTTVKILDFGLAKLTGGAQLTKDTSTLGTVAYMSPEQCSAGEIDQRSDIWSLGVVLYQMLMGQLPFRGEYEQAILYSIIHDTPVAPSNLQMQIPAVVDQMILKALEKDPHQRYQNVQQLISDLHTLVKKAAVLHTDGPSIVVLPFDDISPDKDNAYFSDGLTEEIITDLSQIQSIRVISRTSSMILKGTQKSIRQISKELEVKYILEGSVRKAGNNVRITAQLIDAAHDAHLWAEKYSGTLDNVFDLQEKVSREIVTALRLSVAGDEQIRLEKRSTDNIEAYDLYLRGLHLRRKMVEVDVRKSIDYFEQAIERDPDYALAYAGLAYAYLVLAFCAPVKALEVYPAGKKAVLKALELDDQLPEAYEALSVIAAYFEWDWHAAAQAGRKIIELNPGYPWGYFHLTHALLIQGQYEESIRLMHKAQYLDPLNAAFNRNLGGAYLRAGQLDTAIEILQRTIAMDSEFPVTHLYLAHAYLLKQKYKEAQVEIEKEKNVPRSFIEPQMGVIYAAMDRKEEARHLLKKYSNLPEDEFTSFYSLATLAVALGETEQGLDILEKGYENHDMWMYLIKIDFLLDNLRAEPRFKTLLKKINLDS